MTIELMPFDAAKYLKSDEEIAIFLTDALESGHAGVIASALSAAARAKGLETAIDLQALDASDAPTLDTIVHLLAELGLSLHVAPAAAAA